MPRSRATPARCDPDWHGCASRWRRRRNVACRCQQPNGRGLRDSQLIVGGQRREQLVDANPAARVQRDAHAVGSVPQHVGQALAQALVVMIHLSDRNSTARWVDPPRGRGAPEGRARQGFLSPHRSCRPLWRTSSGSLDRLCAPTGDRRASSALTTKVAQKANKTENVEVRHCASGWRAANCTRRSPPGNGRSRGSPCRIPAAADEDDAAGLPADRQRAELAHVERQVESMLRARGRVDHGRLVPGVDHPVSVW